jgi:GH15 family glucan-1,4-alpha-glucosidase
VPAPALDPVTPDVSEDGRTGGYAALRSYAPIGDTRTIALVASDGSIDWWPVPDLDSAPPFAALIDAPNGGRFSLRPTAPHSASRRYLPGTNVLETTYRTDTGTVRVTDSMNTGVAGRLPWAELGRRVDGIEGEVTMHWTVAT